MRIFLSKMHSFLSWDREKLFFRSLRFSTVTRNRSLFLLCSQKSPKTINWRVLGKYYGYDWCMKSPWLKSNHKTVDLSWPDAAMRLNKLCETERTRSLVYSRCRSEGDGMRLIVSQRPSQLGLQCGMYHILRRGGSRIKGITNYRRWFVAVSILFPKLQM